MYLRARYKPSAVPFALIAICGACVLAMFAVLLVAPVRQALADEVAALPWVVLGATLLAPLASLGWYAATFAEVNNGILRLRTLAGSRRVDLWHLVAVDVHPKTASEAARRRHELLLRLEDEAGRELWLPLKAWRDEELLVARVLRGTVDSRIKVEGDAALVRRFSGLLDTYKSWDRQQAAA